MRQDIKFLRPGLGPSVPSLFRTSFTNQRQEGVAFNKLRSRAALTSAPPRQGVFPGRKATPLEKSSRGAGWVCHAAAEWTSTLSPYETLGLDRNATEEDIKVGFRRMAKTFHPDVYSGAPPLEEGETAESRFIQIQAAYELLCDREQKVQYDRDNRVNPGRASEAWKQWVLRKRKAFEQRGDMALSAWAEQQHRELSLKARQLSKAKTDPEEERRLLAKEKAASVEAFETTLRRHTLVLKKRDIGRQKAEEAAKKRLVADLLAAEGFEIEEDGPEDPPTGSKKRLS